MTCSGPSKDECTSCGYLATLKPDLAPVGYCYCERGFLDLVFLSCAVCSDNCYRCTGPGAGTCVVCNPGYVLEGSKCRDCSENTYTSPLCPPSFKLKFTEEKTESTNFKITLTMDGVVDADFLKRELGVLNYFKLQKVKKAEEGQEDIAFAKATITATGTSTTIALERSESDSISGLLYKEIVIVYRSPLLFVQ